MSKQPLMIKRLHPDAKIPERGTPHSAGYDITACHAHVEGDKVLVSTGLQVAFPEDHVLLIYARSSLAFKYGIRLVNGVAVIDSDFRGEIKLGFRSETMGLLEVAHLLSSGNRIAQMILTPCSEIEFTELGEDDLLPPSIRGEGGFGSTGTGTH